MAWSTGRAGSTTSGTVKQPVTTTGAASSQLNKTSPFVPPLAKAPTTPLAPKPTFGPTVPGAPVGIPHPAQYQGPAASVPVPGQTSAAVPGSKVTTPVVNTTTPVANTGGAPPITNADPTGNTVTTGGVNDVPVSGAPTVPTTTPTTSGPDPFSSSDPDVVNYTNGVIGNINTAVKDIMAMAQSDTGAQVLIAAAMESMLTTLGEMESQILGQIRSQMGMDDPALTSAIGLIRDEVSRYRQEMLEDMNARGVAQSGIVLEMEDRIHRNQLSQVQQLVATRLSELQQQLNEAVMSFSSQRLGIMSQYTMAGIDDLQRTGDRKMNAAMWGIGQQTQLAGMGMDARQWQGQMDQQSSQFGSQMQFNYAQLGAQQQMANAQSSQQQAALDAQRDMEMSRDAQYMGQLLKDGSITTQEAQSILATIPNLKPHQKQMYESIINFYSQAQPGNTSQRPLVRTPMIDATPEQRVDYTKTWSALQGGRVNTP